MTCASATTPWWRLPSFLGQLAFETKRWGEHVGGGFEISRDIDGGPAMDFQLDEDRGSFSVGLIREKSPRVELAAGFSPDKFAREAEGAFTTLLAYIEQAYPWAAENPSYLSLIERLRTDWTPQ